MKYVLSALLMSFLLTGFTFAQSVSVVSLNKGCVSFSEGELGMDEFLMKNLKYPAECIDMAVEGLVIVKMNVDKEGNTSNHQIGLGLHPMLDQEALRLSKLIVWSWDGTCPSGTEEVLLPLQFSIIEPYDNEEWPVEAPPTEEATEEDSEGESKYDAHWAGFDIGMGTLLNDNQSLYPYWNATQINLSTYAFNLFEYKLPLAKQFLGLTTGLGFNVNSIAMNQYDPVHTTGVNSSGAGPDTVFAVINNTFEYRRNNLNFVTFTVPLLIEVCSKKETKNSFYLDLGAVGYFNFGRSWETAGKLSNGDRFQHQVNGRFQMARLGAYATVRTGFDHYGLFANYNLTPLFKKEATGLVYPLTFGVTFNFQYD